MHTIEFILTDSACSAENMTKHLLTPVINLRVEEKVEYSESLKMSNAPRLLCQIDNYYTRATLCTLMNICMHNVCMCVLVCIYEWKNYTQSYKNSQHHCYILTHTGMYVNIMQKCFCCAKISVNNAHNDV